MLEHGYEKEFAERCFAQLRGFATYGFPESHAASFALLVYVSAWIKRHHPAVFCCGLLNSQPMGFYAPAQIVRDAQMHGVPVSPVDVNHSDWDCTLEQNCCVSTSADVHPRWDWGNAGPAVRLGWRRIKGFRQPHANQILASRRNVGHFQSIEHFCRATKLPPPALRKLADADVFQSLGVSRREALWRVMKQPLIDVSLFDHVDHSDEQTVTLPIMPILRELRASKIDDTTYPFRRDR